MSLQGTAWEPTRREDIPREPLPSHRWGLYAGGVLLATAAERATLARMRDALGRGEIRRLPGVR